MKSLMLALVLINATVNIGCSTVAEGDRQLVDQIVNASGSILKSVSYGPESVQAVIDINKNAEVLRANLGAPKEPRPYSPEASAEAREKATEQHQTPWWSMALSSIAGVLLSGGAIRLLTPMFPTLFAGPVGKAMISLIEGIATSKKKAEQSPNQKLTMDDILASLSTAQDQAGVREFVRAYAKRIESKLTTSSKPPAS
jgi:hypothetical protein